MFSLNQNLDTFQNCNFSTVIVQKLKQNKTKQNQKTHRILFFERSSVTVFENILCIYVCMKWTDNI